ncbi:unnamed protein product [Macrosiphum euphorbiae]|uniref:Transposase n=1 Tax=Macrosiphum euphorbiae TaxID=13131 RepID=A0AAV0X6A6_9HEMI|nr:unnamed protein product [Macrosiphum euphorbiae]
MPCKINGTQHKLSDIFVGHKIPFIPCQAHLLNTFAGQVNLSKTRWTAARPESIKAVWISYEQIIDALQDMSDLKSMDKKTCTLALENLEATELN